MKRTNGQGFPKQHFAQGADPRDVMNIGSPQEVIEKFFTNMNSSAINAISHRWILVG